MKPSRHGSRVSSLFLHPRLLKTVILLKTVPRAVFPVLRCTRLAQAGSASCGGLDLRCRISHAEHVPRFLSAFRSPAGFILGLCTELFGKSGGDTLAAPGRLVRVPASSWSDAWPSCNVHRSFIDERATNRCFALLFSLPLAQMMSWKRLTVRCACPRSPSS